MIYIYIYIYIKVQQITCIVFNTKVSKFLEDYCNIIQISCLTSPIRRDRKLQVFIYVFFKRPNCILIFPAGASSEGQWLLINYNKWHCDNN